MSMQRYDVIVIGGGAAGVFGAIQCAEHEPLLRLLILEKTDNLLSKVKISGGGRCNVTHACFDPEEMTQYYPRGHKELRGPFHQFLSGDMLAWLADKGVETHIEADGRIFPVTNQSQTIIDCFLRLCQTYRVEIQKKQPVIRLAHTDAGWEVTSPTHTWQSQYVLLATGSTPKVWQMLQTMGYDVVQPVPSLFTFNIQHALLNDLAGVSVPMATVSLPNTSFEQQGPLLITHWGVSGPAVLKLSAWAARILHEHQYRFPVKINWVSQTPEQVRQTLEEARQQHGKKKVSNLPLCSLPKRLWQRFAQMLHIADKNMASLTVQELNDLTQYITETTLKVNGKSTFKEEFVTCGGIETKQIHFKTMESKRHPKLYFAGEVNNIDAVTGGFNFQAAWTSAYLAARAIATDYSSRK